jgi:hypothetical protein
VASDDQGSATVGMDSVALMFCDPKRSGLGSSTDLPLGVTSIAAPAGIT